MKSSVDEIRERFDHDVERFSNLDTGQSAAIDSPLCLELVTEAAAAVTPDAETLLDIGCGAGNYTLKLLKRFANADATLVDLSQPMLDRAAQRVGCATAGRVDCVRGDIREIDLGSGRYDVAVAAAVLHHLRSEAEWAAVCDKVRRALRPGGSFWIVDLVAHTHEAVQSAMRRRYGAYLADLVDEAYRDEVLATVEKEDSPIPLTTMTDHLRSTGFVDIEILHKHNCFAAVGAAVSED
ncbi:MAG: class I SAM-dependent methyltransferase [Phycisphaeraceae bacterium]